MSKSIKGQKQVVRKPEMPTRNCKGKPHALRKVHFAEADLVAEETNGTSSFITPEFLTVLQLADEVNKIRNSHCAIHCVRDETKLKNLNFMPEEKVYQNLIELDLPKMQSTKDCKSHSSIRNFPKKNQEPDYKNLLKYTLQSGYLFSSCSMPDLKKPKSVFDGLAVYNKLKMWQEVQNKFLE